MTRLRSSPAPRASAVFLVVAILPIACAEPLAAPGGDARPAVGTKAKDFTLSSLDGEAVALRDLTAQGPVVLLMLRGYPGYQCPVCTQQVGEFLVRADDFAAQKARVVLVYPGPSDKLKEHAEEFVRGKTLPANFYLLIDPDYTFTNAYGLRWDASGETAYPASFVIDPEGTVRFAQVSTSHGGRTRAADIVQVVSGLAPAERR